jgi:FkbM family methyltransferase
MHDTFSSNDTIIEKLLVDQHINELWTLSDFHYNYLTNNKHGSTYSQMRNYEVLRNHTWITRNGMKLPEKNRDLDRKQQYHFVFNSNRSKGLHPLLHDVWPQVKKRLPEAKLTVIGGYYKLSKAVAYDDEYEDFMKMVGDAKNDASITFTGILSLESIYDIYAKASYLLYPTEQPETFGISTLEAQYHDMQVLTCKFGALEELAHPSGLMIDYSCTPNALKGNINRFEQAEKLADLALERVVQGDRKLHKAKFKQIREIAGWDTVALEWKQHIYSKLDLYLSASESERSLYTRSQWQKIFGRRVTAPEQWVAPFSNDQRKIVVISPFYNADEFIQRCIHSVAAQIYNNYEHILIDDCSTETSNTALNTIANLPENIRHKFKLIKNSTNQGAVYNHINTIRDLNDDDIVILLDGDDWLTNSPDIFQYYNRIHENNDFTYGSCWSVVDNIPLVSQPYPSQVKANKSYREHMFNWYAPYTHLRTLKAKLIKYENDSAFMDKEGNWFKAGGDLATFYQAIENCESDRIYCSADVVYQYNDAHSHNDYKVNGEEQTKTARSIIRKPDIMKSKKKILIAIPCKNDIEADTFKSIYDLEVPEGYETEFQYFYGYAVDQVRNLIAHWVVNAYDYLLAIDHDVVFPSDTLKKMLAHDKPLVSGVYRQRLEPPMIELYDMNMQRMSISQLTGSLQTIGGCGFGCVLVKKEVFAAIQYPWFVYHQSLNHNNTFSEDLDFCRKARDKGFDLYADTSILCKHIGQRVFEVEIDEHQRPTKAYILRNEENEISLEYSKTCAESCERIGLQYEFVNGPYYKTPDELWKDSNIIKDYQSTIQPPNASASESHFRIWKRIVENKETAIILEHDALMLHPVNMNIPHGKLVNLGYKLYDHQRYNAKAAGPPTELIDIEHHHGCHAYAITYKTAEMLLDQLKQKGLQIACDNMFFIRDWDRFKSDVPLAIMSPTPAICWLRQSTLNWDNGSMESNAEFIDSFKQNLVFHTEIDNILTKIYNANWLPQELVEYTNGLNIQEPTVIYDIGSNSLEWTRLAKNKWKNSRIIAFEAMEEFKTLYSQHDYDYHLGVLSKTDGETVKFYQNSNAPWGNSYYKENENESPTGYEFNESHVIMKVTRTLDSVVKENNWPKPDLIKIDVQGAEMDVLIGAKDCLKQCENIIIELQHKNYNLGAPMLEEMMSFINSLGFVLVNQIHRKSCDGDYHFTKIKTTPSKAIIIYNENEISKEYLNTAIDSCSALGIHTLHFRGYENQTTSNLEKEFGFKFGSDKFPMNDRAACASASHFRVWEYIATQPEPYIILEHDALLLHRVDLEIPDDTIVALGYKTHDPSKYDHAKAGSPNEIININRHSGAHAYVITPNTAKKLLEELKSVGAERAIDNYYFMRKNDPDDTESSIKLALVNPIAALAWVRQSTIWKDVDATTLNYDSIESFLNNYSN